MQISSQLSTRIIWAQTGHQIPVGQLVVLAEIGPIHACVTCPDWWRRLPGRQVLPTGNAHFGKLRKISAELLHCAKLRHMLPVMRVSLFVACLTDLFAPDVGMAVVQSLEHFGCEVDFPTAQTCCGQPAFNNGFPADARTLAIRMLDVFQNADYVVTPSGSCCAMIRAHYPELFHDDPQRYDRAVDLAARCYEYVEFITKILKVDLSSLTLPEDEKFTYHYTCHLRTLGASGAPAIALLKQLGGASFTEMEKADQCCGFGGTFAIKYTDISGAMVRDKVQCGAATGADTMIVNDGGCAMNISGGCHRHNVPMKVRHISQIIAAAIEHSAKKSKVGK